MNSPVIRTLNEILRRGKLEIAFRANPIRCSSTSDRRAQLLLPVQQRDCPCSTATSPHRPRDRRGWHMLALVLGYLKQDAPA
jgi:hypothetical protein